MFGNIINIRGGSRNAGRGGGVSGMLVSVGPVSGHGPGVAYLG